MFHQKADGIPTAATTKALIDFFGGRNGKRGGLLIMKRAETEIVRAPLLQFHKTANDIDNVDTALDLLYGLLCDQNVQYQGLKPYPA